MVDASVLLRRCAFPGRAPTPLGPSSPPARLFGEAAGDFHHAFDNRRQCDRRLPDAGDPAAQSCRRRAPLAQVRLEQAPGNRLAFGAWVGLERRGHPTLWRRVGTAGSYLSASDARVHFGMGTAPAARALTVHWPDGTREGWSDVEADQVVTLRRGTGAK